MRTRALDLRLEAHSNLGTLKTKDYIGRGVVAGVSRSRASGVLVEWITARSKPFQNRRLEADEKSGCVYTVVADPTQEAGNPETTAYDAMRDLPPEFYAHVVSNGSHTDTLVNALFRERTLSQALEDETYEDDPMDTPRIAAVFYRYRKPTIELAILRKSEFDNGCERDYFYREDIPAGYGYCLTTYAQNGNPPPTFRGAPFLLPLEGNINTMAATLWNVLSPDYRIAIAVKHIDLATGAVKVKIINKHPKT